MEPVNKNRILVDMNELRCNRKQDGKIAKKKKTMRRSMRKQTNNNSSNSGRMLARTDNQAGRCIYISVWSTTMAAATTSDQSESMRKINKPYGNGMMLCFRHIEKLLKNKVDRPPAITRIHMYKTIFRSIKRIFVHLFFFCLFKH
jgi:hypothetical protein